MEQNPEGQEGQEIFTDGIQPVDMERIQRILGAESDPRASQETLDNWEIGTFGDKGDTKLREDEQFRLYQ